MVDDKIKKSFVTAKKWVIAILSIFLVGLIIFSGNWIISILPDYLLFGSATTETEIVMPDILETPLGIVLDLKGTSITLERLVFHLAIFIILLFSFSEIITLFSTFSETTSWVIGFCLAVIAGVTKSISLIAGILGFTAGIGALGVGIIIISTFLSAVVLHIGFGEGLRKWRIKRQGDIIAAKSMTGAKSVKAAIESLKEVEKGFEGRE